MIKCGSALQRPISEGFNYFPFSIIKYGFYKSSHYKKFILHFEFEKRIYNISSLMISDLEKQLKLLRQYNKALEDQNNCRNQERKLLEAQVQRLGALQRQGCLKKNRQNQNSCLNCKFTKIENQRLEEHIKVLQSSKSMFQKKVADLSEELENYRNQHKMSRISSKPIMLSEYSTGKNSASLQYLLKQNVELKNQLHQNNLEISRKQRQLRNIELENEKKSNQHYLSVNKLNTRISQMESALNQAAQNQDSQNRNKKLETENKQLLHQIRNLQNLVVSYSHTISNLSQEVQQFKKMMSSVPEGNRNENYQVTQIMNEQLKRISQINRLLTEKMQNQAKSFDSMQMRIINLQKANRDLQSELRVNTFSFKDIAPKQNGESKNKHEGKTNGKQNQTDSQLKQMIIELQKEIIEMRYPKESSEAKLQVSTKSMKKSVDNQSMTNLMNSAMADGFNAKFLASTQKTGRFSPKASLGTEMGIMNWNQLQERIKDLRNQNSNLKKKLNYR